MKLGKLEKKTMISQRHAKLGIEHVERLLQHVKLKQEQNYLEIGCGNGHVCKHIAGKYQVNVTGTDVDPEMVQFSKESVEDVSNVRFKVADATNLPFQENEFDIVLSFGVLHHIANWSDALSEINRVLRSSGYYIFGDIAYSKFSAKIIRRISKNYGAYTILDIILFLKNNGFEIIHEEPRKGGILKYYSIIFRKK